MLNKEPDREAVKLGLIQEIEKRLHDAQMSPSWRERFKVEQEAPQAIESDNNWHRVYEG